MSWSDDELMARALVGELTPDQEREWNARWVASPAVRFDFDALVPVVAEVEALPSVAFEGGFADRVMARVSRGTVFSFDDALRRQFRWIAPMAAAASIVLLALNVSVFSQPEQSTLEAVAGLDPITVESVYSIGEGVL